MKMWITVKSQLMGALGAIVLGVTIMLASISPLLNAAGATAILLGFISLLVWVSMRNFARNEVAVLKHKKNRLI